MGIISLEESSTRSGLNQEDGRTCWLRELTTGESTFQFQVARVNSAQSGDTGKLLSFLCATLGWSLLFSCHWSSSSGLVLLPHSRTQDPDLFPLLWPSVQTVGLPMVSCLTRGFSFPVCFSLQCVNCSTFISNKCQSMRWQVGTNQ